MFSYTDPGLRCEPLQNSMRLRDLPSPFTMGKDKFLAGKQQVEPVLCDHTKPEAPLEKALGPVTFLVCPSRHELVIGRTECSGQAQPCIPVKNWMAASKRLAFLPDHPPGKQQAWQMPGAQPSHQGSF